MSLQQDRIAKGQCPNCGKEAAPYRLCFECRQGVRLANCLKKGAKVGALSVLGNGRNALWSINKNAPADADKNFSKNSTPFILPETDRRSQPRLRGIRVDVEATLIKVIEFIGRPCTMDEIVQAWGKLRSKRSDPLPNDLARIIQAQEKRERRALKRAATPGAPHP